MMIAGKALAQHAHSLSMDVDDAEEERPHHLNLRQDRTTAEISAIGTQKHRECKVLVHRTPLNNGLMVY